ncbi:hypothetical protein ID866_4710 [Astraeus odoratus]|nr:hypothetical protein ID866_4710 [Astraeus odoratus]
MDGWGEDGWNDTTSNNWTQPSSGWGNNNNAPSVHSSHTHATSRQQQGGWQNWGVEAQRLPKVTFDPAIPPSPSTTGNKSLLPHHQLSQTLSALLNRPQQSQQPYPNPPNHGDPFPPHTGAGWQQAAQKRPPQHVQQSVPHQIHHQVQQVHHQMQQQGHHQAHQQPFNHDPQYEPQEGKKNKKNKQQPKKQKKQQENDAWGLGDGWSDFHEEEEHNDGWERKVHFPPSNNGINRHSPAQPAPVDPFSIYGPSSNKLGLTLYNTDTPMSRTLSYAYQGAGASPGGSTGRIAMQQLADVHFIESHGHAIKGAMNAFYGRARKAGDRFHWLFPPEKDERVASLLSWIDMMSFAIASFGLQKFLQVRERGALFINVDYFPPQAPNEPALDWVSWAQIQPTMDRILQESVGYYNPATHVLVFVYLPSPSGNSVAIWRRRLTIPNNIRRAYQAQITQVVSSLQKEYKVYVEELPPKPEASPPPPPPKKKRKWYKLWLST